MYFWISLIAFIFSPFVSLAANQQKPAWSYDDDYTGQEDWGAVPEYKACEIGMEQSPVVISFTKKVKLPALNFKYSDVEGSPKITKKSFIIEVSNGGILIDGEIPYKLETIEFHSPSGHRIKDRFFPVEIHLIHRNMAGNALIVAVFTNIANENRAIEMLLQQVALNKAVKFSIKDLLPDLNSYYSYKGSLPYPPCTENVQWRIMKKTISISRKQLSDIDSIVGRNSRLPQPLYIREVLEAAP